MATDEGRHPSGWVRVLLALALVALCWRLGGHPLVEPDEGRNAEVAREMARGGDYVLPHLDGLPYLDKPAPYFAAVAVALKLCGESELSARLPSLLFTLLAVGLVWALGRRLGPPPAGELSALALATMPLVFAFSRAVIFDSALALLETLALVAAWRALEGGPQAGRWAALAWAAMGLGTITKGPVALLIPLLVLAAFALAARVSLRPLVRHGAWLWFLVVGLPWFAAVLLRRPDFPRYAFVHETFERVTTGTMGRGGPLWYFLPVAVAGAFPWSVPALAAAAAAWRRRRERRAPAARPAVFLAAWAIVPLVFFSLSRSKLPGYYLPALPAWALAAGLWLAGAAAGRRTPRRWALVLAGLLAALAVALLLAGHSAAALRSLSAPERAVAGSFTLALGVVLATAAVLALVGARRRHVGLIATAAFLPLFSASLLGGDLFAAVGHRRSSGDLAAAIARAAPRAEVVGIGAWPTTLRYYLDRPLLLATATGAEMTSNYVVSRLDEMRALPGSPLRPAEWWRERLAGCRAPTVFVVRRATPLAAELGAALPLIAVGGADSRYAVYGPCRAPAPAAAQPAE